MEQHLHLESEFNVQVYIFLFISSYFYAATIITGTMGLSYLILAIILLTDKGCNFSSKMSSDLFESLQNM